MKIKWAINQSKNIPVYNLKLTNTKQMLNPGCWTHAKSISLSMLVPYKIHYKWAITLIGRRSCNSIDESNKQEQLNPLNGIN